jgi:hypothetical protein
MSIQGAFLALKCVKCVFSKFNDERILHNYSKTSLMSVVKSLGLELVTRTLVSSAKMMGIELFGKILTRSFM